MEVLNIEWNLCLSLALEGIVAGSFGISAIIVNGSGEVISRGRNQLYDTRDSCNIVKNTPVSHAELNAIAGIPLIHRENTDLILYATVEPCPMCLGAIVMSKIKKVKIASKDPWAGSMKLLTRDYYLEQKGITVEYETGLVEEIFFLLSLYSVIRSFDARGIKEHPALDAFRSHYPVYYAHADILFRDADFISALYGSAGPVLIAKVQALIVEARASYDVKN